MKRSLEPVWDLACEFTVPTASASVEDEEMDALFEVCTHEHVIKPEYTSYMEIKTLLAHLES